MAQQTYYTPADPNPTYLCTYHSACFDKVSCILGNLSGDREHVQWNPIDFILLMIKGVTSTLSAPNVDWQVEMTPVDFVSEMIVKMTQVRLLVYWCHTTAFDSVTCKSAITFN